MTAGDHALAVQSLAAGAVGAFLAGIGLTDAELLGVVFGACVLGSLRAPAVGRKRGLLLFVAAMLVTAKLAQAISPALAVWFPVLSAVHWRTLVAIGCGTMLYPVLQALWDAAPSVVERFSKRGGGAT
jgi:hypothetical protein